MPARSDRCPPLSQSEGREALGDHREEALSHPDVQELGARNGSGGRREMGLEVEKNNPGSRRGRRA